MGGFWNIPGYESVRKSIRNYNKLFPRPFRLHLNFCIRMTYQAIRSFQIDSILKQVIFIVPLPGNAL